MTFWPLYYSSFLLLEQHMDRDYFLLIFIAMYK